MRAVRVVFAAVAAAGALCAQSLVITTPASLPSGKAGAPYSVQLTAAGGVTPYRWALAVGPLPAGLTLNTAGVLQGTPTSAGLYQLLISVTDAANNKAYLSASITISPGLTVTTPAVLPGAVAGQSYKQTLSASGGIPPYQWTASQLPSGLALDPASGNLSGTPAAAGTFSFVVQVADSAHVSAQASFTLTVAPATLAITTVGPLFAGTVGVPYSQTFAASGGAPPYSWSVVSGSTGSLTLDAASGVLQGTPQSTATLAFTIQVADSAGVKASGSFSISIQAPTLVLVTGVAPPPATAGAPYAQTISASATGGTPPYTWSLSGMPPGLSFDPASLALSGTPSTAGSFSMTLEVDDSAGKSARRTVPLTVAASTLSITTPRQLPAAVLSAPFAAAMSAIGGVPPYNWSATGLPAGLAIDSASGIIGGAPTAAGTFSPVVVTVTDGALNHYSDNFAITVGLPALPAVTVAGLPPVAGAASQYPLTITLAAPYPANLTGQAILTFTPVSGLGDRSIAFASGGGTASFTIPAGTLTAVSTVPLAIQTGTAAGNISISLRLQAGGVDVTPAAPPSIATSIQTAAPVITGAVVTRTSNSLSIAVTGYATGLEVTQAVFTFAAASGQTLQSAASSVTLDVSSLFGTWFGSSNLGGQFLFTQPFSIQGDPAAVLPQSVTLTNRLGSTTFNISQ
jgi:hypothetical protein